MADNDQKRCRCILPTCFGCAAICLCVLLAITDVFGLFITRNRNQVCVIGAGIAGLSMLKELSSYPNEFEPIGFDINSDVGGLWIYSDSGDLNEHGLPTRSAAYKNLRTNTPRMLMTFPDFQTFDDVENRSCVKHEAIHNYLRNYTEHFGIRSYIRFNTFVEKISRAIDDEYETTRWYVHSKDLNSGLDNVTTCDSVVIGNGVYFKQIIGNVPGIESFPGRIIHSHAYRRPEDYSNQTVVLLGAGTSGIDIAVDLSSYANKIYLSHRHDKITGRWPSNVEQVRGVISAKGNRLTLDDNKTIVADSFIYCSGYQLDFPFLDASTHISYGPKYVESLYKHMINAYHPTMVILGMPTKDVLTFPLYYIQAKYYAAYLRGKFQLPSLEERLIDAKVPEGASDSHQLPEGQFVYFEQLAKTAGFDTVPDFYQDARAVWTNYRIKDWPRFKDNDIVLVDGRFVIKYR